MKKGFTLLELLVVISIIGILLAIGTVSFTTAQKKSRDSRRQGDIKAIQKSLEQCYSVDGNYLVALPIGGDPMTCTGGQTVMNALPVDPKPDSEGEDVPYIEKEGTWTGDAYTLCADLEETEAEGGRTWEQEDYCVYNQQ